MKLRAAVQAGAAVFGVLGVAAIIVFQDTLTRFLYSPQTPFQIAEPPPRPDYRSRDAWILRPEAANESDGADIFYTHSTTYYGNDHWNAPIGHARSNHALRRTALPNEVGPFLPLGAAYAPRYRQATLFSFFTHKYDGVAARRLAYSDVKRAFTEYLSTANPERPLLLVGYEQGGLHVLGLLRDFFQNDESLRRRLAAAYVIGQATPLKLFDTQLDALAPCLGPEEVRCVISYSDWEPRFDEEMRRTRERSMAWTAAGDLRSTEGEALLCVNPLLWTADELYAPAEHHRGAASATGLRLDERPPAISRAVGARCDDGVLRVDRPRQDFLRRSSWFGAKWRAQDFNLFYADLAEDARRRLDILAAIREEEAQHLGPIEEVVEVEISPVNKAPH